jgi:hypothetical protein
MYERMSFGKHFGRRVCEVPTAYLAWVARECLDIEPQLRAAVLQELARRQGGSSRQSGPTRSAGQTRLLDTAALRGILTTWFREMSMRFHPDRTGTDGREMVVINAAAQRLKDLLGI